MRAFRAERPYAISEQLFEEPRNLRLSLARSSDLTSICLLISSLDLLILVLIQRFTLWRDGVERITMCCRAAVEPERCDTVAHAMSPKALGELAGR